MQQLITGSAAMPASCCPPMLTLCVDRYAGQKEHSSPVAKAYVRFRQRVAEAMENTGKRGWSRHPYG